MNIFYIDLNLLDKDKIDKICCSFSDAKLYADELKKIQHCMGLYLVDFVAKKYFNIQDDKIIYKNKKPMFEKNSINFSISHSRNIVMVVFSEEEIGLDVEYNLSDRNFTKILDRYDQKTSDYENFSTEKQRKIFYDFWTKHEAKIKLGQEFTEIFYATSYFLKDFTISVATINPVNIEKLIDINL